MATWTNSWSGTAIPTSYYQPAVGFVIAALTMYNNSPAAFTISEYPGAYGGPTIAVPAFYPITVPVSNWKGLAFVSNGVIPFSTSTLMVVATDSPLAASTLSPFGPGGWGAGSAGLPNVKPGDQLLWWQVANTYGIFNVHTYGAVGDGIATRDEGPAITAAMNAAGVTGRIYFPPGIYRIKTPILMTQLGMTWELDTAVTLVLDAALTGPGIQITASGCWIKGTLNNHWWSDGQGNGPTIANQSNQHSIIVQALAGTILRETRFSNLNIDGTQSTGTTDGIVLDCTLAGAGGGIIDTWMEGVSIYAHSRYQLNIPAPPLNAGSIWELYMNHCALKTEGRNPATTCLSCLAPIGQMTMKECVVGGHGTGVWMIVGAFAELRMFGGTVATTDLSTFPNGLYFQGNSVVASALHIYGTHFEGSAGVAGNGGVGIRYTGNQAIIAPDFLSTWDTGVQIGDPATPGREASFAQLSGALSGNNATADVQIVAGGSRTGTVIMTSGDGRGAPLIVKNDRFTTNHIFEVNRLDLPGEQSAGGPNAVTATGSVPAWVYMENVDASLGAITRTLPATTGSMRRIVIRKIDTSTNLVTIALTGGDTIDTFTPVTLAFQWDTLTLLDTAIGRWSVENAGNNRFFPVIQSVPSVTTISGAGNVTGVAMTVSGLPANAFAANVRIQWQVTSAATLDAELSLAPHGNTAFFVTVATTNVVGATSIGYGSALVPCVPGATNQLDYTVQGAAGQNWTFKLTLIGWELSI